MGDRDRRYRRRQRKPAKVFIPPGSARRDRRFDSHPAASSRTLRGCPTEYHFMILQPDGSPVGSLEASGFTSATPPGAPRRRNLYDPGDRRRHGTIRGARGQISRSTDTARVASMLEDPAYRRVNGGKAPGDHPTDSIEPPEVVATPAGRQSFTRRTSRRSPQESPPGRASS